MSERFGPTSGRAAARRFVRNRPALLALLTLIAIAGFCALGPFLVSARFDRAYPIYVRAAPSLTPYPTEAEANAALVSIAERMHAKIDAASFNAQGARITLTSPRPIDERLFAYFERSDAFRRPRIVERRDDGRTIVLDAPFKKTWLIAGADANGRDLLTRMMIAGRISLLVGVLGCAVAATIGVVWGAVSGYAGGRVDTAMMRVVDILYALPFLFFVILLVVVFGRKFVLIFVAIGAVEWLDMARIVRGQTLSLKQQEFVLAARGLGVAPAAIVSRHIVPNLAGPVAATLALLAPRVILLESFLSFLGLGLQEPLTSLGVLVAEGARNLESAPWMLVFPATLLLMTLLAFNFLAEGLSDALDPRER
jgi:oligopeptide transport system permease protein